MQDSASPPRRGNPALRYLAVGAAAVIIAVVIGVVAFRNAAALGVLRSTARGLGYELDAAQLNVTLGRATARDVTIRTVAGEPVFDARGIDVGYSLRDLLPGGKRLFGLKSVDIEAPHVTVIHHPDGSYNITLPKPSAQPPQQNSAPLDIVLHVADGSVDLVDRFVRAPHVRRERLVAIRADGRISPASGSYYHAGAELDADGGRYPIRGEARFDDPHGFEFQHWTAARLPIAGLANFALSGHSIVVEAGEIRQLDVKLGALATAAGTMQPHLGATGMLTGGQIAAAALTAPVRDAHGSFVVDDDGATVRTLDARLNGIALHASGALYHFAAPQVAFGLTARGDLSQARALSKDTARLPLTGAVTVAGLAEGAIANPVIFARVGAPRATYATYRFDGAHGFAAISGSELDVIEAGLRYGPAAVTARAALVLTPHTRTTAVATIAAPTNGLPYAANLLPGVELRGVAVASGRDARISARGYLAGANGADRLDAPFALAATGSGSVGPVVLQRRDGATVYARAVIDRARNQTVALADVSRLSLLPAANPRLPGLVVPALPPKLDATVDAALAASVAGTTPQSVTGRLHAYGAWGDARADAAGSPAGFAARGNLRSSFERLAAFTGNVGARGGIDVPFAVTNARGSTIVQVQDARFPDASVRGIALQAANATLGIAAGRSIDVYAADLRVAGHDVTAAGRFGNGGSVHLTAGDLDLDPVRAAGVKVSGGRATVIANVGGTFARPTADLRAALSGASYAGTTVGGNVGLAYDGAQLRIDRATLTYGGAYADAGGTVGGLVPGRIAPRYDIAARLEDADIAALARTVKNPLRYPQGTLDAEVRVRGAGAAPSATGDVRIPEGSLNGLSFGDGRVDFAANPGSATLSAGRLSVGTTTLTFAGSLSRARESATLHAPQADLADFNDYFDEADVLAGTGSLAVSADVTPRTLKAGANVALRGTRIRRFELGRIDATVSTAGTRVAVAADVDGQNGRLVVNGSVVVPATDPPRDTLRRSYVDLNSRIAGIDLGNVLPAAGLNVPVLGIVDGSAVVRGVYPALALSARAELTHGVAGRVPIDRFTVAATAAGGRGRLTDLTLLAPGLSASASGAFGLRPADPFDLRARVTSPDVDQLATVATGKNAGVHATLSTDTRLTGTIASPHVATAIDLANLTYKTVTVPSVHADVAATRAAVDVRNGNIALPRGGSIGFDGHAPLGGGPTTPIAFDFTPHRVDLNPYSSLLPDGSVVAGIIDGNVGVRGTPANPLLSGQLALSDGAYRSNLLTSGITGATLELDFAGTTVTLAKLHAKAGSGNIDGSGTVAVRDLRDPVRGLAADASVTLAGARIAAPKYYTGYIDGTVTARKSGGAPLTVGGNLAFSSARIPYTALVPSGGSTTSAAPALPAVALNLGVTVGRDVRIQSGPVDIGTTGSAQLGGTLARPTLDGTFTATDGTVSLYRTFTVQNGSTVSFDPSNGVTPSVDATAVTNVPDPPTNVLLRVTGPADHLSLAFSSDPPYSQQQILGLLVNAQAFGAVSGVAQTSGSASNGVSIAGVGEGLVANQFTQKFLQPFSSKLGGALGLSDLNVNYSTNGAVSATARRNIGKNISFVYGEQFGGTTQRSSLGINIGSSIAGAQLTFFQTTGSQSVIAGLTPFLQSGFLAPQSPNYTLESIEPPTGSSGYVFTYQRKFW